MRAIATTGQKKASIGVWRQDYVWGYLPSKWIPPQKNKKDGRVIHKTAANISKASFMDELLIEASETLSPVGTI
jgi:hypothetical protein